MDTIPDTTPQADTHHRTYDIPAMLTVHITGDTDEHARTALDAALANGIVLDHDTGDSITIHQITSLGRPTAVLTDVDNEPYTDPHIDHTDPHRATTYDPTHPSLRPQPDETLVSYDGETEFPALIDTTMRSPAFRPDVALQIAHYVTAQNARSFYPDDQDWLVIAPDQRSIIHLLHNPDTDRHDDVYGIHSLADPDTGQPHRVHIGSWRWTWAPPPPDIHLDVCVCATSHYYTVIFSGLHAEQMALDYITARGRTPAFHTIDDHPIDHRYERLLDRLFPTCPHGLSERLCHNPIDPDGHYPPDL